MTLPRSFVALTAALTISLVARCRTASAQIVNIQPLVGGQTTPKAGLSGSLEGSIDWRVGNTRLQLFSASALARYVFGDQSENMLFAMFKGDIGTQASASFLRRHFEHLRYRVVVFGPVDAEFFVQYQEDAVRRVAVRALFGLGPRLRVLETYPLSAAIGCDPMFEFEQLGSGDYSDSGLQRARLRLSNYLVLSVQTGEKFRLTETAYLQPSLSNANDLRVLHEIDGVATITKALSAKWTLSSMYDSHPPQSVDQLDVALKTSLLLTF